MSNALLFSCVPVVSSCASSPTIGNISTLVATAGEKRRWKN
ncbi:hypothetical protein [Arcicella aurantiaca]|nr:hypothetical protein [Arcicella aurantiaca]